MRPERKSWSRCCGLKADWLCHVNTMDGEIFNTVIQRYIGDKKKDAAKLMMYASKLGVEKKARRVVGIWL